MTTPAELTQRQFAEHIGVKPGYVTQLKHDGRLVLTEDGRRVKVAESVERIESTRSPDKAHVAERHAEARESGQEPTAGRDAPDDAIGYQESRARREHFAALQAELDYRKAAGSLIELESVRAALADTLSVLRNGFENMPDILAPQIAPIAEEAVIRARLAEEVEALLAQVSERFAEMGKGRPTEKASGRRSAAANWSYT